MPETFFQKHRYTLAGLAAISVILGGGVFTFVGSNTEKTRNVIRDNTGPVIGVGEEVTLEPGAVVINEYDRDAEVASKIADLLGKAVADCEPIKNSYDDIELVDAQQVILKPAHSLLTIIGEPTVASKVDKSFVDEIDTLINGELAPNAGLISFAEKQVRQNQRQLEQGIEQSERMLMTMPEYKDNPELREQALEQARRTYESTYASIDPLSLTYGIHEDAHPKAKVYDVMKDSDILVSERLAAGMKEMQPSAQKLCVQIEKIATQL